ncbi:MAG: T9SS type A sorting domain-containing protein [Chitinophagaceae bacterium]
MDTSKRIRVAFGCWQRRTEGNKPLIILDGQPVDLSEIRKINPNEIDNITVLKGPAAEAIYGSAGIDGALIIQKKWKKLPEINIIACQFQRKSVTLYCGVSGVYIRTQKASVSKFEMEKNTFSVYPNPVRRGTDFEIRISKSFIGDYQIRLTDLSGKILTSKNIVFGNGKMTERIHCDEKLASGIMFVQLSDDNDKSFPPVKILVL